MRRAAGIFALALVLAIPGSAWAGDAATTDETIIVDPTPTPTPEPVVTHVFVPASITYRHVADNVYEAAWTVAVMSNSPTGVIVTAAFAPIPDGSRSLIESCVGWSSGPTLLVTDGPTDSTCTYTLRVLANRAGTYHSTIAVAAEER
jgi:hypothetical protein